MRRVKRLRISRPRRINQNWKRRSNAGCELRSRRSRRHARALRFSRLRRAPPPEFRSAHKSGNPTIKLHVKALLSSEALHFNCPRKENVILQMNVLMEVLLEGIKRLIESLITNTGVGRSRI